MSKKVAILQSNYIPWKGYFDLINSVDEFILYDDMQFTRRDWRNRNLIKTPGGVQWLTIPVEVKGKHFQKIKETKISDPTWSIKHWNSIKMNFSKAKYFKEWKLFFEELYLGKEEIYLSEINYKFIVSICKILGITTEFKLSSEYNHIGDKSQKLVGICKQAGANEYFSGPSAKNYLDEELFEKEAITINWMDYTDYPQYRQLYPPFEHKVSIIDLIFNEGPNCVKYMKSFNFKSKDNG